MVLASMSMAIWAMAVMVLLSLKVAIQFTLWGIRVVHLTIIKFVAWHVDKSIMFSTPIVVNVVLLYLVGQINV